MAAVTRVQLLLLIFLSVIALTSYAGKKEKPLAAVADLRYGVALYHYYQAEYLDALTELMIAKERGGIQGHGDNPALMEGGFALAYGLERTAADIFDDILAANVSESAQVNAWYYLARMRYMRGDWEMANRSIAEVKAINEINKKSSKNIKSDLDALKINLAIKQNKLVEAESLLKKSELNDDWLPYIYFNIGSAAAREQQFDKAIIYYNRIAEKEYPDDEYRSLYDKAMTAAGYSYLLSGNLEKAMERFSRVRLDSSLSGRALLGYGWAAVEREDYREALKVWLHLSKSSLVDENSQEALVAVPYAYEKMGMEGLALEGFKKAEQSFQSEVDKLDEVIQNLSGDALLQALNIENEDGVDWLNATKTKQLAPQLSYLIALFSHEQFQMGIQELRDLLAIQKNTLNWQVRLKFYNDMLSQRAQDREDQTALLSKNLLEKKIEDLQQQRDALALNIETIAGQKNYFALATGDEEDLIHRAQRAKQAITIPELREDDPFIEDTDEAVRRYYGLLLWNASEQFSDRLWKAVKTLNSLDTVIEQLRANYASVEKIMSAAPDIQPYRNRIVDGNQRLNEQSAAVDKAVDAAKEALRQQVISVLIEQRARIHHYMAQSRLSVARLYDKTRQRIQHPDTVDGEGQP
ncbi:tetratricopeptide repeat protein [Teredinibacter haidensis]|uniref:tetratricopeptide repeat protein n=1 Tax=Teredinibacter haidensis TaxID=2731755 RepID=UPI000948C544|nr:tetratricopeptide repeat protein [Teredinibacter haidensis]